MIPDFILVRLLPRHIRRNLRRTEDLNPIVKATIARKLRDVYVEARGTQLNEDVSDYEALLKRNASTFEANRATLMQTGPVVLQNPTYLAVAVLNSWNMMRIYRFEGNISNKTLEKSEAPIIAYIEKNQFPDSVWLPPLGIRVWPEEFAVESARSSGETG